MKILHTVLLVLVTFGLSAAHAAEPGITFVGVLGKSVMLADEGTKVSRTLAIGDDFEGYAVTSYDPAAETVVLTKAGVRTTLKLKDPKIGNAPAPAVSAEAMRARTSLDARLHDVTGLAFADALNAADIKALIAAADLPEALLKRLDAVRTADEQRLATQKSLAEEAKKAEADQAEFLANNRDPVVVDQGTLSFMRAKAQNGAKGKFASAQETQKFDGGKKAFADFMAGNSGGK